MRLYTWFNAKPRYLVRFVKKASVRAYFEANNSITDTYSRIQFNILICVVVFEFLTKKEVTQHE